MYYSLNEVLWIRQGNINTSNVQQLGCQHQDICDKEPSPSAAITLMHTLQHSLRIQETYAN